MRGRQLLQLVSMLRDEIGRATSVAVGVDDLSQLKQKLTRTQELLYDEFDWPFLRQRFTLKALHNGEQFYDLPAGLNLERVEQVHVWYSGQAIPLTRGIGVEQYSVYNSNTGVTSDPAMRWDVQWTGTKDQIEIWPIPATESQSLQFTGIRNLRPMIADGDVADLDDIAIVLTAAAEMLAKQESPSAAMVAKLASLRLARVKGRVMGGARTRRMGQGALMSDGRFPITVHARAS